MSCLIEIPATHNSSPLQTSSSTSSSSSSASPSPDATLSRRRKPLRDEIFRAIDTSVPHKFRLRHFREEEESYRYIVHSHEEICRTRTKDMYQLLGMFAVFQGVVFSAVSQSTVLSCADVWSPVSLSATACVATVLAVNQKLASIDGLKQEIRRNKDRGTAVYDKIEEMKLKGMDFDFGEPEGTESAATNDGLFGAISIYGMTLQAILVIFSLGIIVSCVIMLCRECKCD